MATVNRLLRAAVRLDRSGLRLRRGLRYAVGVGTPLVLGVATNHVIEGVAVSTGALLVGLTDSGAPYRRRVRSMLTAALVVAAATLAGELVGAHDTLTVVILVVGTFAAGLCISAGTWTYLIALMGPITFVGAASVPTDGPHALGRAGLVLAGALLEVSFVVVASRLDPVLPERVAVARLYRSLATWLASGRAVDDRGEVFLAVAGAREVCDNERLGEHALSALTELGDRIFGDLALLRDDHEWWDESDCEPGSPPSDSIAGANGRRGAVGALYEIADQIARPRTSASISLPSTNQGSEPGAERLSTVSADLERSWALACGLPDRQGRRSTPPQRRDAAAGAVGDSAARLLNTLGTNLTSGSIAFRHAIRLTIAVGLAATLARALAMPHGYWVPLTVLWLLRPDFGSTFTRGIQRYVGTMVGAVIATLFATAVHPGPYALSVLAMTLSVGIFCFMLANYAMTGVCVTGWVVFVSALAGIPELHAAADRVLDTSLGAVLALGAYLLWPSWERSEVADAVADVIDADRRYAVAVLDRSLGRDQADDDAVSSCRTTARLTRTDAEAILARSITEPASSPARLDPEAASAVLRAMRHFCDGPLSLEAAVGPGGVRRVHRTGPDYVTALDDAMHALADATRAGQAVDSGPTFERLRTAHRAVSLELGADEPLRLQAAVMVAAVEDAALALSRDRIESATERRRPFKNLKVKVPDVTNMTTAERTRLSLKGEHHKAGY